jgi:dTDP-4-dehydrorhamnose 3,5-epimerase
VETNVTGACIIELERRKDKRGFFARSWCHREFAARSLKPHVVQINVAYTAKKASLRGLHYQVAPHQEAKTVRCTRGAIIDVTLDLRRGSPTVKKWVAIELSAHNHRMLYIAEGCVWQSYSLRRQRNRVPGYGFYRPNRRAGFVLTIQALASPDAFQSEALPTWIGTGRNSGPSDRRP